ncbi:MAG: protein-export membrane protein SecF [Candidatus Nealsonbacteria bacterium RIFOXYB1_FULL_40_15]|uniref:Protein-export membrane protein SecF n=2 Tax=Candidatus Nealsoniibacteriota TaxID=1817911 RepID=A0A1G2ERL3_9BACT|nr:MAG: protein-export membrane protein SecF [Candidatus Nealsonbacteria bacterium RIFOXYB1_FULL_40_15]OGZ28423.1 MAG: protein-export membrane protein SecF [Candidatus Nealsonbacteria bacterium RIFOXYC1_FULL_40_7]OGZ29011.1 MAG: protein-export membrane protein SecF [Candidatus Nealsonbacteria bacterium RIFOXYD1_FULL_39_11]
MSIVKYRKIYFVFSGILILVSLFLLLFWGLKPGIDFTGGSIVELEYKEERPSNQSILEKLSGLDLGTVYVQPTGDKGVILRMKDISEEIHQQVLNSLRQETVLIPSESGEGSEMQIVISDIEEKRFDSVGPVIGQELKEKTKYVVIAALACMIIYIALAFRRLQRPLRSWHYGIASVIALLHDIIIPLGVFALLGRFYNIEISIPIITALLAVLGYSINNTVVVFDRIRENLSRRGETFEEIIDESIRQTFSRQINTSLTTLFVAGAIFFLGGSTLQYFALTLILGILAGTYSSIFLAGPLLASWQKIKQRV